MKLREPNPDPIVPRKMVRNADTKTQNRIRRAIKNNQIRRYKVQELLDDIAECRKYVLLNVVKQSLPSTSFYSAFAKGWMAANIGGDDDVCVQALRGSLEE